VLPPAFQRPTPLLPLLPLLLLPLLLLPLLLLPLLLLPLLPPPPPPPLLLPLLPPPPPPLLPRCAQVSEQLLFVWLRGVARNEQDKMKPVRGARG
jgi:hypothetical protein